VTSDGTRTDLGGVEPGRGDVLNVDNGTEYDLAPTHEHGALGVRTWPIR
jgi:hypothetical protein